MIIYNGPYSVYAHTNKINNMIYIGATSKAPHVRYNNGEGYRTNKRFYADIKEYGWDNFIHEVIASNLTENEAFNFEKFLIEGIKNKTPSLLYNLDAGGKNGLHCKQTKDKIREVNIGKFVSEETKNKIKEARARQIITPEQIEKTAQKNRGKNRTEEFKRHLKDVKRQFMKSVFCQETGKTYESITAASKDLNVDKSGISSACNSKTHYSHGYHFYLINSNDYPGRE